jgi:hypothetical protein
MRKSPGVRNENYATDDNKFSLLNNSNSYSKSKTMLFRNRQQNS